MFCKVITYYLNRQTFSKLFHNLFSTLIYNIICTLLLYRTKCTFISYDIIHAIPLCSTFLSYSLKFVQYICRTMRKNSGYCGIKKLKPMIPAYKLIFGTYGLPKLDETFSSITSKYTTRTARVNCRNSSGTINKRKESSKRFLCFQKILDISFSKIKKNSSKTMKDFQIILLLSKGTHETRLMTYTNTKNSLD